MTTFAAYGTCQWCGAALPPPSATGHSCFVPSVTTTVTGGLTISPDPCAERVAEARAAVLTELSAAIEGLRASEYADLAFGRNRALDEVLRLTDERMPK